MPPSGRFLVVANATMRRPALSPTFSLLMRSIAFLTLGICDTAPWRAFTLRSEFRPNMSRVPVSTFSL
ncbi:hypothetical protein D3C87_1808350 [compost metagenome]